MDFAHLHVASAYSLRYGASMPDALVARAAEHGQRVLALTDRDGVYGAVRFVRACAAAGISPVLGVDLALDLPHVLPPDEGVRHPPGTPLRGGAWVDPRHPRAVFLARDKRGWASLCRLLTAVHAGRGDEARGDTRGDTRAVAATSRASPRPACIAVSNRHSDAQPRLSRARRTARGWRGSTHAPPLRGVPGGWRTPSSGGRTCGRSRARSTPRTGEMPAAAQARTKRTAP